jgi:hypothetical protein
MFPNTDSQLEAQEAYAEPAAQHCRGRKDAKVLEFGSLNCFVRFYLNSQIMRSHCNGAKVHAQVASAADTAVILPRSRLP